MTFTREQAIAEAEAVIEQYKESYGARLERHLADLRSALHSHDVTTLTRVANLLKGEAGTMGWPLVSQAAGWLRQVLDAERDAMDIAAVTLFVQSLERMVADQMVGEPPEGIVLVKELHALALSRGITPA